MIQQLMSINLALWVLALTGSPGVIVKGYAQPQKGNRVALVIGNDTYSDASLQNPVNDAKAVAKVIAELGFQVDLALNLNFKQMEKAIDRFVSSLQPRTVALFYYAGHGIQIDGENYLIPTDFVPKGEADAKYAAYSASRLVERMEEKKARVNIIILDACRNNPFRSSRSTARGLSMMSSGEGTFIAFSTGPNQIADDGPRGSNSPFARYLIETLKEPALNLDQLFSAVRKKVASASSATGKKQVPWISSSVIGEVILNSSQPSAGSLTATEPTVEVLSSTAGLHTRTNQMDEAELVFVPAGRFLMGSNDIASAGPVRQVQLDGYWIYRYEVTNEQFAKFVQATGYQAEGAWRMHYTPGKEKHPVVGVSWNDAAAYAKWADGRLPTEAEWEKAARGTDGRSWTWGDKADKKAANLAMRQDDRSAVGSFSQDISPYGCFDMTGNVREWTASLFAPYSEGEFNRQGMGNGERVVRGGSWRNDLSAARIANRDRGKPYIGDETRGFRCVVSN